MSATTSAAVRNGVDTPAPFTALGAVKANTGLAKCQFRAGNQWITVTHDRTTVQGFHGAGRADTSRTEQFAYDADHATVPVSNDSAPTPVESLLHAIAVCLTSGLANIAAAREVTLAQMESTRPA